MDTSPITFHSRYIVKIIDYGRCYIKDNNIYQDLCDACIKCGYDKGYSWLKNTPPEDLKSSYYTTSLYPNVSHDLRCYQLVHAHLQNKYINAMKPPYYRERYGTSPIETDQSQYFLELSRIYIVNVSQCCQELSEVMKNIFTEYDDDNILAFITVYGRFRPMDIIYNQ